MNPIQQISLRTLDQIDEEKKLKKKINNACVYNTKVGQSAVFILLIIIVILVVVVVTVVIFILL